MGNNARSLRARPRVLAGLRQTCAMVIWWCVRADGGCQVHCVAAPQCLPPTSWVRSRVKRGVRMVAIVAIGGPQWRRWVRGRIESMAKGASAKLSSRPWVSRGRLLDKHRPTTPRAPLLCHRDIACRRTSLVGIRALPSSRSDSKQRPASCFGHDLQLHRRVRFSHEHRSREFTLLKWLGASVAGA